MLAFKRHTAITDISNVRAHLGLHHQISRKVQGSIGIPSANRINPYRGKMIGCLCVTYASTIKPRNEKKNRLINSTVRSDSEFRSNLETTPRLQASHEP